MFSTRIVPVILIINSTLPVAYFAVIDLGGSNVWDFYTRASSKNISGRAVQVPGDIYADLEALHLIEDPLYGGRDQEYKWVSREKWTYERTFQLPENVTKATILLLHLDGLDNTAQVSINGQFLLRSDNQFKSHVTNLKNYITDVQNSIKIDFESPVEQAKKHEEDYEAFHLHKLPPDCTAEVQNGECGAQFLRKVQASFSWDWGPAFPTVGIWKPIFLEYFLDLPLSIVDFHPLVLPKTDYFLLQISIQLACPTDFSGLIEVEVSVDGLELRQKTLISIEKCPSSTSISTELELEVARSGLELWYPRGYGAQRLYTLTVGITTSDGKYIGKKSKKLGFRTVELVQNLVDERIPEKGRHFYFKINGIPIFLKGTNWIPISPFPARNHSLRLQFLMHSMAEANLNALRVWGGGMYETEDFYELTDKLGLVIWHDLMFACALYPTDQAFLNNIREEVDQQVRRLRHHPSILAWAGNNENEVAIASNWWYEMRYDKEQMIIDYKKLYYETLKPLLNTLDASRPYLLSSPSNGVETEKHKYNLGHRVHGKWVFGGVDAAGAAFNILSNFARSRGISTRGALCLHGIITMAITIIASKELKVSAMSLIGAAFACTKAEQLTVYSIGNLKFTGFIQNATKIVQDLHPSTYTSDYDTYSWGQGGYSQNPGNTAYGDIHFYTDTDNLWKDSTYKIPRHSIIPFEAQFSTSSVPNYIYPMLRDTMTTWINDSEWAYGSRSMNLRQHHAGGALNNLALVYQHFDLPPTCRVNTSRELLTCEEFVTSHTHMDDFSFLSQVQQAVAMQVESEHYRRWRSTLDAQGQGNTMCAIYWQLNDVWAAPSWSSIDYNLSWKMLHYFARRFFAPLIVSMYVDKQDDLQLYIISDLSTALRNTSLSLQVYILGGGFQPIHTTNQFLPNIPALSSIRIQVDTAVIKSLHNQSPNDFIIQASVNHKDTFPAILLPDKLYNRRIFGQVKVVGFKMLSSSKYLVELRATNIVPVVWLDLSPSLKSQAVLFYFSDNAFAMVKEQRTAVLQVFDNPEGVQIGVEDIVVRVL